MPALKTYNVLLNGRFPTTIKLNEDDAKRRGLTAKDLAAAPAAPDATAKKRGTRNKAATPANKAKGAVPETPAAPAAPAVLPAGVPAADGDAIPDRGF